MTMELNKQNLNEITDKVYDVLIVGGGPGGLSAAIYAQRFGFSTLIIDKSKGRALWMHKLTNYFGVSPDTSGAELLKSNKERFVSLGGDYLNGFVESVKDLGDSKDLFELKVRIGRTEPEYKIFKTRYLIIASGVMDMLPELEDMGNVYSFAGYNLHVCLICDGREMRGKISGLFVNHKQELAPMIARLSWFTDKIKLFTMGAFELTGEEKKKLENLGIAVYENKIKKFLGDTKEHVMTGVELEDGTQVEIQTGIVSMGSKFNTEFLKEINLEMKGDYIKTDSFCRTSNSRVFAIGDIKYGLNQVAIAVGDGANAVSAIWREHIKEKVKSLGLEAV